MRSTRRYFLGITMATTLTLVVTSRADLPRNTITVAAAEPGGTEKCVRAVAPNALCAAASDVASTLVVGTAPLRQDGALLVFSLGANGAIAQSAPTRLPLTKPASLAKFKVIPTAIYAHPRAALIYVWQDVMPADGTRTIAPVDIVRREFDHLLIFKVAGNTLELVKAAAREPSFGYGIPSATLGSDATTVAAPDDRLFLPNMRRANLRNFANPFSPMLGYVTLDEKGLPAETDGALAIKTIDLAEPLHIDLPIGLFAFSKRTVFIGASVQIASVELDGNGPSVSMYCEGSQIVGATGHPTLPRVYGAGLSTEYLYNFEHVDGAFTMIPQRASVTGLSVQSIPLIDAKANQLVVGGADGVHLIALNDQGMFVGTQHHLSVAHAVRAMAYSSKFDRIYVPVEKLP